MHRRFDAIDEILCDNITSHTNYVYDDISQKTCILLYRKNNNDPLVLQIVLITYGSPFSSSVLEVSSSQPIKFHCVKSVQIRSFFSGPNTGKYRRNSVFGHFSRSVFNIKLFVGLG